MSVSQLSSSPINGKSLRIPRMLQTNPIPENLIARGIVDAPYRVHSKLGPGLLESVYESALAYELGARGMR